MASQQENTPRRNRAARPAAARRSDVIRCDVCGEDYSVTYRRCPFCDSRTGGNGKRVATNSRGGGYGKPINPIQIVGLLISLGLIAAALYIVFTKIGPLLHLGVQPGGSSVSTPAEDPGTSPDSSVPSPAPASSGSEGASVRPEAVTMTKQELSLAVSESYTLNAAVSPEGVAEPILWSSDDSSVATVDSEGKVTNVNASGEEKTAVITASCGDASASCTVRCASAAVPSAPSGGGTTNAGGRVGTVDAPGGLNIRSGPGSQYERIASANNGARVEILEDAGNGWYKVEYRAGKTGYVSASGIIVS